MKMLRKCDDAGNLEEKMSNACENEYMRTLTQTRESTFHGLTAKKKNHAFLLPK